MADVFILIVVLFVVVAVTVLIFGGWVILNVIRGVAALLGVTPRQPQAQRFVPPPPGAGPAGFAPSREVVQCRVPGCRHPNPVGARFCRHCGHAFPRFQPVAA